jgi:hypothetical protein
VEFAEWLPGKHWAINILLYIKKIFHLEVMFKLQDSPDMALNKEAHKYYNENFTEFMKEVKKCV